MAVYLQQRQRKFSSRSAALPAGADLAVAGLQGAGLARARARVVLGICAITELNLENLAGGKKFARRRSSSATKQFSRRRAYIYIYIPNLSFSLALSLSVPCVSKAGARAAFAARPDENITGRGSKKEVARRIAESNEV